MGLERHWLSGRVMMNVVSKVGFDAFGGERVAMVRSG